MIIKKKQKAGVLQFVILLSIIFFSILTAFIAIHYFANLNGLLHFSFKETQIKNIENTYANLENNLEPVDFRSLTLKGSSNFKTKQYGAFRLLKSQTSIKKSTTVNYALLGGKPSSLSIELANQTSGLTVSGNTNIQGNVALPKQGIKAGYVNGNYYNHPYLVKNGKISTSKHKIADFTFKKELKTFINNKWIPTKTSNTLHLDTISNFSNSFNSPLKKCFSSNKIILRDQKLAGKIIIQSLNEIEVHKSCSLKDIILIAPKITLKKGTHGIFQALASEQIVIEENCDFDYPSAFIVYNQKIGNEGNITILNNTAIKGIVAYLNAARNIQTNYSNAHITIHKNCNFLGDIYCNGNLSLSDNKIEGSIRTQNFIYRAKGSTFVNTLFNVDINATGIFKEYAGLNFNETPKIVKWLY